MQRRRLLRTVGVAATIVASGALNGISASAHEPGQRAHYFKRASYAGVSFSYGSSLAQKVVGARSSLVVSLTGQTVPAIAFRFDGYLVRPVNQSFRPFLQVFPASVGHTTSNPDVRSMRGEIRALRSLLRSRPPLGRQRTLPYILLRMDSPELVVARAHYVRFGNGSGVAFVTAMSLPVAPISNATPVIWVFRGLTDDGRWVVAADMPLFVSALPRTGSQPRNRAGMARLQRGWRAYAARVQRMLNHLPGHAFVPYLSNLDILARSLDVHPRSI